MLLMGTAAVGGGSALSGLLADSDAAIVFAYIGSAWLLLGFGSIVWLNNPSRNNSSAYLRASALRLNLGCTSMCLAMSLPILFVYCPASLVGGTLTAYATGLSIYQVCRVNQYVTNCWESYHAEAFAKCFDPADRTLKIEDFMKRLHINVQLFLPTESGLARDIVYVVLLIAMVCGLNLRKVFPEASALAWGIPSLTIATILFQVTFVRVRVAAKLRDKQHSMGIVFVPKL